MQYEKIILSTIYFLLLMLRSTFGDTGITMSNCFLFVFSPVYAYMYFRKLAFCVFAKDTIT